MDWFKPDTADIGELALICLGIVFFIYLLTLRKKTNDAYLFIFIFILSNLQNFATFVYDSNINSTSFAVYAEYSLIIVRYALMLGLLWVAYRFYQNIFPRESVIVPAIYIILCSISFITWFKEYQLNKQPSVFNFLLLLSLYAAATLHSAILFLRKIKAFSKQNGYSSLFSELLHPSTKEVIAFRSLSVAMFIFTLVWLLFLLTVIHIISWLAWHYMVYVLNLSMLTLIAFTYFTYASEQTSFQAKLVGITLFIVLSVVGIIPLILFGETRFVTVSDAEENQIKAFVFIIPATTFLISIILPLLFRLTILKNLNKIIAGVQQVNAGDLSANVNVEVNDEIGKLSRNFNRMTGSLQRYAEKMNDLVDERTNELKQSLQELKSTQAQLIQSEKMASLGELTAGIAHEIQNPLNFVNNFSELSNELLDEMNLEMDKGDIEEAKLISNDIKQNLEKINHHGKRADSIVKGMLQHSRQSKGVREAIDINALCDEYLRLSYHGLKAKDKNFNADFNTEFDETIGSINIVPQDMGRVLLNLFNNAFYAVNEKGKTADKSYQPLVAVQTKRINNKVEIIVSDNGSGIPQNIIDKIFQPFFTTKPTGQGTGLGLSLSYDIITKEHNGTIKVESNEGEGSEFIVQLPIN